MPPSLCDLALVDAHAHLCAPQFADDLDEVVARAAHRGVQAVLCVSETVAEAERVIQLADRHPLIKACAGLYPTILDRDAAAFVDRDDMLRIPAVYQGSVAEKGRVGDWRGNGRRIDTTMTRKYHLYCRVRKLSLGVFVCPPRRISCMLSNTVAWSLAYISPCLMSLRTTSDKPFYVAFGRKTAPPGHPPEGLGNFRITLRCVNQGSTKSVGQSGSARFSFNRSGPGLQPDTTARTSPHRTIKGSRPDLQHEIRPTVFGALLETK